MGLFPLLLKTQEDIQFHKKEILPPLLIPPLLLPPLPLLPLLLISSLLLPHSFVFTLLPPLTIHLVFFSFYEMPKKFEIFPGFSHPPTSF